MEPKSKRFYEEHRHAVKNQWSGAYKSWANAKKRCYNPKYEHFSNYGGRGIEMCSRWKNSFMLFYEDMGERPEGYSLDRIDVDKGYEPSNCKWSSRQEQQLNKRKQFKGANNGYGNGKEPNV